MNERLLSGSGKPFDTEELLARLRVALHYADATRKGEIGLELLCERG